MRLDDVVGEVVTGLAGAGVRAVADARDLNPPAVYVVLRRLGFDRLAGYTAQLDLFAVVPAAGRSAALASLGELVDQVRAVWDVSEGYLVDVAGLDVGDPLPAVRLPLTVHACDEET